MNGWMTNVEVRRDLVKLSFDGLQALSVGGSLARWLTVATKFTF